MSDTTIPDAPNSDLSNDADKVIIPFPSLPTLHTVHVELVRRQRETGITAAFLAEVDDFIQRGSASGVLLDADNDREAAQSMLDYWSTILYREGQQPSDATLAEFDPDLAPELDDSLCPYVGLDAFREDDQAIFFGRQRAVVELLERLEDQRLLAVIGPSGSGKSSVVRAGLIPALQDGALPGSDHWRCYPPIVPGADPLRSLARLLQPPDASAEWMGEQLTRFRQDSGHLARLLGESAANRTVLCIDQFEEVFTLAEDESSRRAFIDNLLHLAGASDAGHIVILTMRSDFEAFVARVPELQARFAEARVQMTPLSAAELREAIERPAAMVGLKFEAGVVEGLLQDLLGEPAALPLLQFTLLKLWESRSRNRVTQEAYRRLGGGRLALARSADEFYASLIPEEQVTARRILLRMVRPGDGLEVTSNRIQRVTLYQASEAADRIDRVLGKLIQARLVRITGGVTAADEQIEVAHEALVRNWPTLVDWLEDERAALSMRRRLEAKAAEWVRLGRGSSGLLDREQLLEAEHWLAGPDAAYLGFDPALPELAVYSRAAIEEAEHEQEAARQRELHAARALAQEQQRRAEAERQRAELEARTNKRLTWLFRALAVAAIIAVGAAILAFYQASRALIAQGQAVSAQEQAISQNYQLQTAVAETNKAKATADANAQRADANAQRADVNAATAVAAEATTVATSDQFQQQQRIDRANLLAAVSQAITQSKPRLSLLLAVEALRVTEDVGDPPAPTAIKALTQTLANISGRALFGHTGALTAVAISTDGGLLLTGGAGGILRLWDLNATDPAAGSTQLTGTTGIIKAVAISADTRWLVAGGEDGTVHVWETNNPSAAPRNLIGNTGPITSLVISPNNQWLVTSGGDSTVRVWNMANLDRGPLNLTRHTQPITGVTISADSRLILTSSADGTALLWDLTARNPENSTSFLETRPGRPVLTAAALSPNNSLAAIAGADGTIHLWTVRGASFTSGPTILNSGQISALAIDPGNRWVVTGSADGIVRLWNLTSRTIQHTLTGHTGPIIGLTFSQDGSRLVTGSADRTARVWNLNDPNPALATRVLLGHESKTNTLALTPDGRWLATGSDDTSVHVWDLADPAPTTDTLPRDPKQLAKLACEVAGRDLTTEEWKLYFDAKAYRKTCGT